MNVNARHRCDECTHFAKVQGEMKGQCRRLPPTVFQNGFTKFPELATNQWCGEWASGETMELSKVAPVTVGQIRKEEQKKKAAKSC